MSIALIMYGYNNIVYTNYMLYVFTNSWKLTALHCVVLSYNYGCNVFIEIQFTVQCPAWSMPTTEYFSIMSF